MTDQTSDPPPLAPLVIAHRGARAFAPENTLEAVEKAAAIGADMVEVDVQLTHDGQLVVVHDDTLDRCSDVRMRFPDRTDYRVPSFTLSGLRCLDAGSWFVRALREKPNERPAFLRSLSDAETQQFIAPADLEHFASGRVRPPTLEETLTLAERLGLRTNIELKPATDCSALVEPVLDLVRSLGVIGRVLISSFDHASLRLVRSLDPAIATGVLVRAPLGDPVAYCRLLGAAAYHPGCVPGADCVGFDSAEFRVTGRLPAEPIRSLRAAGIAVNVWTENDPRRMQALIDAGVSGIFTDYPNRLVELLRGTGR